MLVSVDGGVIHPFKDASFPPPAATWTEILMIQISHHPEDCHQLSRWRACVSVCLCVGWLLKRGSKTPVHRPASEQAALPHLPLHPQGRRPPASPRRTKEHYLRPRPLGDPLVVAAGAPPPRAEEHGPRAPGDERLFPLSRLGSVSPGSRSWEDARTQPDPVGSRSALSQSLPRARPGRRRRREAGTPARGGGGGGGRDRV